MVIFVVKHTQLTIQKLKNVQHIFVVQFKSNFINYMVKKYINFVPKNINQHYIDNA